MQSSVGVTIYPNEIITIHEQLKEIEYLLSIPYLDFKNVLSVFGITVSDIEKPKMRAYKLISNKRKEPIGFQLPDPEKNQYYIHKSNILVNGFECPLKYPEPSILSVFEQQAEIAESLIKNGVLGQVHVDAGIYLYVKDIAETYNTINRVIKNKIQEDKSILTYCVDSDISDFIKQYHTFKDGEYTDFYNEVYKELNLIFR